MSAKLTGLLVVVCLIVSSQSASAELAITAITGDIDSKNPLDRFLLDFVLQSPNLYVDGKSADQISISSLALPKVFSEVTVSAPDMLTVSGYGTVFTELKSGNSTVTFTGLNEDGDNWVGLATNTENAATFHNADSISVDFSLLGPDTGGSFQLTNVPEPTSFVTFGLACTLLARCRRR